ncbi:MAG TPA: ATP-binding cassette domain-containing protein, partial [Pyrinomonadaceae bacterium]
EAVRADQSQGNFQLKGVERTGNQTLIVKDLAVGYPGNVLATDITFTLSRGEALGVIGPNGSGKTTFIKTLLNKLPPIAGEARWGTKVNIGYYAQQLDDLDDRNEIIMELRRVAPSTVTAGELRGFLAKFLFVGDDVYKHVRDLSGGEKGRLALAKLIYSRVNVLVLDEPTNHLDIPSREALEEALDAYEGTIITISHDRYFLDRVATQILALDGQSAAEHYDGDYTEYHDWKALTRAEAASAKAAQEKQASALAAKTTARGGAASQNDGSGNAARKGKASDGKGGKKKSHDAYARTTQVIESEIAEVEKQLAALSGELSRPEVARDVARAKTLNDEYQQHDARLRSLYDEWEQVSA